MQVPQTQRSMPSQAASVSRTPRKLHAVGDAERAAEADGRCWRDDPRAPDAHLDQVATPEVVHAVGGPETG